MSLELTTEEEIVEMINSLRSGTAAGYDNILTCITSPFAEQTLENSQLVTKPRNFFNTLSYDVRNASSVSLFQSKLKKYLFSS